MLTPASRQRVLAAHRGASAPSGFSIIELLMVAAIIAVMAALAAPRYGNSVARYRADGAARRIEADLEFARDHAMTTSSPQEFRYLADAGNPRYRLVGLPHPDNPAVEYEVLPADDLFGAEFVSVDFGGDDKLFFDMYGMPDSGGSIVISNGGHVRTITIDVETGLAVITP